ncbi:MAG: polyprenyl synthetase family protein [Bdellovibrionales bacterium]|nr:polyprenyl synthetase family protein [Bdellovibrionales bacterium]
MNVFIAELIQNFSVGHHRDSLNHHFGTGGKKLRARLALAATKVLGGSEASAMAWASACEILHNATLIHDDVQDGDRLRRGQPTVWAKYGVAQAINAGDSCLVFPFLALQEMVVEDSIKWRLAKLLAVGTAVTVRGQAMELELIESLGDPSSLSSRYLTCIEEKTSALFEIPITGAALLSGFSETDARALGLAIKPLGLLFQMQDDVVDLYGAKGRDKTGNDLREGKVSCLVAEYLALKPGESLRLRNFLAQPRAQVADEDVDFWIREFRESGALHAVLGKIRTLFDKLERSPALKQHAALHEIVMTLTALAVQPIRHLGV